MMLPISIRLFLRRAGVGFLLTVAGVAPFRPALGQQAPAFTQIIVFGDSLSDDGNITRRVNDLFFLSYPGHDFDYADGRFTNSTNTFPPSLRFAGVWHEQLAGKFLQLAPAFYSLSLGLDYAFGGATTNDGVIQRTVISNVTPFGGGQISIRIDNLGQQITNYLASHTPDPGALYVVWGGGNDLFDDAGAANLTATANRVGALVSRLAVAGARNVLVPNIPPLGAVPHYNLTSGAAALNAASDSYRTQLNAVLDATSATLVTQGIAARIYRLDIFTLFQTLVAQPAYFGFTNTQNSAQFQVTVNPDSYLFWDDIHPTAAAHFQIAAAADRVLSGGGVTTASLVNIAARSRVETGENYLIGGFVVAGTAPKRVLVRAIGPSLTARGVVGALSNPGLVLFNGQGQSIAANDNWRSSQQAEISATALAPTDDRESAIIATLAPGDYTAIVYGVGGEMGVGLVEVYDLDTPTASISRPINVAARARVLTGANVLIGGFVIAGTGPRRVIVRGIGPSLAQAGVQGWLADPTLTIFNAQNQAIATNDNWKDSQQALIAGTSFQPNSDAESAIVITLAPGAYTAVVSGKGGATGVALVEIYDLD